MAGKSLRFAWYELMTTDVGAARAFYTDVMGWRAQEASTADLNYTLFIMGDVPACGLLDLPEEARKVGATPRWIGHVAVDDAERVAEAIASRGGTVLVPPTPSNIGRIAVVADPQGATLSLVEGLRPDRSSADLTDAGQVGWHELFATDPRTAFGFYSAIFGWQTAGDAGDDVASADPADIYQSFAAGERTLGGMVGKPPFAPAAFWLYYFNTGDIDTALRRVTASGGQVFEGPHLLPGGQWFARCADPQGAVFALQGKRNAQAIGREAVGWSTSWGEFSSKGRMVSKRRL
jgi:predicted enzyme related to lactoylglutathione lyase